MTNNYSALHIICLVYWAGVVVCLCVCFIKPYWLISAAEWEELLDRQHEKHPTIRGKTETLILCAAHVLMSLMWPFVGYILLRERLRA